MEAIEIFTNQFVKLLHEQILQKLLTPIYDIDKRNYLIKKMEQHILDYECKKIRDFVISTIFGNNIVKHFQSMNIKLNQYISNIDENETDNKENDIIKEYYVEKQNTIEQISKLLFLSLIKEMKSTTRLDDTIQRIITNHLLKYSNLIKNELHNIGKNIGINDGNIEI